MSNAHININEDLLAKYFASEASNEEKLLVDTWRKLSVDNESEFEIAKSIWENSTDITAVETNVDEAWQKVQLEISKPKSKVIEWKKYMNIKVAAVFILSIGLAFSVYYFTNKNEMINVSTTNSTQTILLADGTKVYMNKHSSISYPKKFNGEERHVLLSGEAYFEVAHDATHPFVIFSNSTSVKVLGTTFNVKANPEDSIINVAVLTGRVQVATASDTGTITANQQAIVKLKSGKVDTSHVDASNKIVYATGILIFESTPLDEVISTLNEQFNTQLSVKNQLINNCRLTARFKNESFENILKVVAETLELTITRDGDKIYLDGKGC